MALRSKFQSCSAHCSAYSIWETFALWATGNLTSLPVRLPYHDVQLLLASENAQFSGTALQGAMNLFAVAIAQSPAGREHKHVRERSASVFLHWETSGTFFYLEYFHHYALFVYSHYMETIHIFICYTLYSIYIYRVHINCVYGFVYIMHEKAWVFKSTVNSAYTSVSRRHKLLMKMENKNTWKLSTR